MTDDVTFEVSEVDGRTNIRAVLWMRCSKTASFPGVGVEDTTERVKRETAAHLRHYAKWVEALAETHDSAYRGLVVP